jgi:hypothetical protein
VPRSILYDNTKLAVARILGDGRRQRTRTFNELQSHYLFADFSLAANVNFAGEFCRRCAQKRRCPRGRTLDRI